MDSEPRGYGTITKSISSAVYNVVELVARGHLATGELATTYMGNVQALGKDVDSVPQHGAAPLEGRSPMDYSAQLSRSLTADEVAELVPAGGEAESPTTGLI